jgi:glycosyltransferase involved in cell wall biosynthesis
MLSVIICTYNRDKYIYNALKSIAENKYPYEGYEIIMVNNNSTDNTEAECRRFGADFPQPTYSYYVELQQGLSYARNKGIKEAKGDVLIFIDDDAVVMPDYLEQVQLFFNQTPNAAACGGRIYPCFESRRPRWMSHFLVSLTSAIDLGSKVKIFSQRQFPIGANMAIKKAMLDKYGVFNTDLGRKGGNLDGGEEKDLFYRMISGGEKIYYVPNAIAFHFVPDSRLTFIFFKKQALGIGKSERVRAKNISKKEFTKSIIREMLKWEASFALFLFYFITLRPEKAWRLLVFRWHVSCGLLGV